MHNRHISVNELLQGACQRPVTIPAHLPMARFWAVRCAPAHFRKSEFSGEVAVTIGMGDRRRSTDSAVPPRDEQRRRYRCSCGRGASQRQKRRSASSARSRFSGGVEAKVHPNRNADIILPPILSLKSRVPGLAPAAPATTISGKRCSSRGWHARADGALSH
jgi:hypothetical protein